MVREDESGAESICLDTDRIVDVGGALGPDPVAVLTHVLECADCREALDAVGAVEAAYAPAPTPTEAVNVVERVIERIAPIGSDALLPACTSSPNLLARWGIGAANWVLAAAAGFFGVMIVSSGNAAEVSLQGALMAAALTGLLPVVQGAWLGRAPIGD